MMRADWDKLHEQSNARQTEQSKELATLRDEAHSERCLRMDAEEQLRQTTAQLSSLRFSRLSHHNRSK
jgi:hypothetical protein